MGVDVDQPREDGLAGHVANLGIVGDGHGAGRADGGDAVVLDEDVAAGDDFVASHGDEAGSGEGDGARGFVFGEGNVDVVAGGFVDGGVVFVAVV